MSLNSDNTEQAVNVAPKKKRKSKRRWTRRQLSTEDTQPKRKATNLAGAEIDSRIAQAIRDRAEAMAKVSELVHWQDRLQRLEQEINSLIGFQQRLSGNHGVPLAQVESGYSRLRTGLESPAPPFSHLAAIPDGVTSIPTKVSNPKPSGGNVADLADEGGFS